jgi:hypothetical protein
MKKILTLICFAIFGMTFMDAQTSIYIGPQSMIHHRSILNQNNYGQRELEYVFDTRISYGAAVGIDFNNRHLIQLEANIMQLGQSYEGNFNSLNLEKEVTLNYLQLPLTYRFVTGSADKEARKGTHMTLSIGGYIALQQSADIVHSINNSSSTFYDFVTHQVDNRNIIGLNNNLPNRGNPNYDDLFTSQDIGALAGIGVQSFLNKFIKISLEARAGVSLKDINDTNWRFLNISGDYGASRNFFGGISLGLMLYL